MSSRVRRVRRKRRVQAADSRRWLLTPGRAAICLAAVVVGFSIGVFGLTYGPRAFTSWREGRLMKRATVLLEKQNYEGAARAAQQVLQRHPDSLPAFFVLAEASEKQNRAETVTWRAQIARLLPDHLDSHLNLASAALRFGQLDTARKALENVAPEDRDKAAYHVVAGWLARAHGHDEEVEKHFAAAVQQEPNSDLYQFNLAVLQLRSPSTEKSAEARTTLERLTKVPAFRAGSLRALLSDAVQQSDFPRADNLAQDLQMSQQVTFSDYLLCLDFYRKLDEKKFSALLEKVKPVAARDASDAAMLMDWMNKNGLAQEVLKWMEKLPSKLTTQPPPSIAIAEAFAELKNWSRLKRWTRSGSWGNSDFLRLAYQAYAARQSRQSAADAEFDSLWRSAERAANDQPDREITLARLATKWNLTAEAEPLWLRVSNNSSVRREALDSLFRIYRANNDLRNLYRIAQRLHESSSGDPVTAANFARLALLMEHNASEGHRVAKEAYDKAPTDVNCAVTYAFSLYGLGRTAEGIEIIRKLPPESLREPHAAVYATVLLLDENQTEAAREFIEIAQKGPIHVEEKKLLEEVVSKAKSVPPNPAATASPLPAPSPAPVPPVIGPPLPSPTSGDAPRRNGN